MFRVSLLRHSKGKYLEQCGECDRIFTGLVRGDYASALECDTVRVMENFALRTAG